MAVLHGQNRKRRHSSIYGLLTVSRPWPAEFGPPSETEVPIHFSTADLEAAASGKVVTHAIYLAKQAREEEPARIETMNNIALPPETDAVAEASRRGSLLAIVKLSKLRALRHSQVRLPSNGDADASVTNENDTPPAHAEAIR